MVNEAPGEVIRFPFDIEFQQSLFRVLLEDEGFSTTMARHIKPFYFENPAIAWSWSFCQRYQERYGSLPAFSVILHQINQMEPNQRMVFGTIVSSAREASLKDNDWLKDQVLEFVKRNIFVRGMHETRQLYNSGKVDQAFDFMMGQMEELHRTTWETRDRSWFLGDLEYREQRRLHRDIDSDSIPTGFPWLDHILDGGLTKGEVGNWLAYPKIGKTTMLIQHGRAAAVFGFKKVYHAVLEGSRALVENRYDACFMDEFYNKVKRGDIEAAKYDRARRQYDTMKNLMVVEGFVDRWDYTVTDIDDALKELRVAHGWVPDLVIIDYGDLLCGRHMPYRNRLQSETDAFRDIKSLANRGYGLWTASQAQRPKEGADEKADLLKTRQIAGVYDKVRICDFLGTLNQNLEERRQNTMRVYAEMYRDNAADQFIAVQADLAKMRIEQREGLTTPSDSDRPKRGGAPRQKMAPV